MPKFSIGMAHCGDFHGVYFTIQAIRSYFPEFAQRAEFIVVNNGPDDNHSRMVQGVLGNIKAGGGESKYIHQPSPVGTSTARNRIFAEASGEYVISMDCHVLLMPGSFEALEAYFDNNPDTGNLVSGPMLSDSLRPHSNPTHFNNIWRADMWGVWGVAWACRGCDYNFTMVELKGKAVALDLMGQTEVKTCKCRREIPSIQWAGHEKTLIEAGFVGAADDPEYAPFEIPGMGLGFYACRRDKWQGFNEHARNFGGEELWYHEKVRRAGYKAICHPGVRWLHRFGRPDGAPYPLTTYDKIRNYVLEFNELGLDLTPIQNHFIGSGKINDAQWKTLIADPIKQTTQSDTPCPGCRKEVPKFERLDDLVEYQKTQERDLNQHIGYLSELASKCDRVTEFSHRRDSTIAFFNGIRNNGRLISYNVESGSMVEQLKKFNSGSVEFLQAAVDSDPVPDIEETDLLFLDTKHTYDRVTDELRKFAPMAKRFIAFHDTVSFGLRGDDGGPGLVQAIVDFLREHPSWFLYSHTPKQFGLTVIATETDDIPLAPVDAWVLGFGPGSEMHKMLALIGINPSPSCGCVAAMNRWDAWTWRGCTAHKDECVEEVRANLKNWQWDNLLTAAAKSLFTGLAWKIDILDPVGSLVEIAIRKSMIL